MVALDIVSGEFVGSDKPTPDPPDLAARRRPLWAGVHRVIVDAPTPKVTPLVVLVKEKK